MIEAALLARVFAGADASGRRGVRDWRRTCETGRRPGRPPTRRDRLAKLAVSYPVLQVDIRCLIRSRSFLAVSGSRPASGAHDAIHSQTALRSRVSSVEIVSSREYSTPVMTTPHSAVHDKTRDPFREMPPLWIARVRGPRATTCDAAPSASGTGRDAPDSQSAGALRRTERPPHHDTDLQGMLGRDGRRTPCGMAEAERDMRQSVVEFSWARAAHGSSLASTMARNNAVAQRSLPVATERFGEPPGQDRSAPRHAESDGAAGGSQAVGDVLDQLRPARPGVDFGPERKVPPLRAGSLGTVGDCADGGCHPAAWKASSGRARPVRPGRQDGTARLRVDPVTCARTQQVSGGWAFTHPPQLGINPRQSRSGPRASGLPRGP